MLEKVERIEDLSSIKSPNTNNTSSIKPDDACKIFVGGLSWDTTRENLYNYFIRFGDIADCVLMYDPQTQRSRGFGFVTFTDPMSVIDVLTHNEHILDNKLIDPKAAVPRGPLPILSSNKTNKSTKIFVGGIGQCTEDDLHNYFSMFGNVTDVTIMMDKLTGRPRGFAFVGFTYYNAVETTSSIRYHNINGKMVEVKKAQPREVKVEHSSSQSVSSSESLNNENESYEKKSVTPNSCSQQYIDSYRSLSKSTWHDDNVKYSSRATSINEYDLPSKSFSNNTARLYEKSRNLSCKSDDDFSSMLSDMTRKGIIDLLTDIWR